MSPLLARVEYIRAELDALSDKLDDLSQQIRDLEAQPPQREEGMVPLCALVKRIVGRVKQ